MFLYTCVQWAVCWCLSVERCCAIVECGECSCAYSAVVDVCSCIVQLYHGRWLLTCIAVVVESDSNWWWLLNSASESPCRAVVDISSVQWWCDLSVTDAATALCCSLYVLHHRAHRPMNTPPPPPPHSHWAISAAESPLPHTMKRG